MIANHVLQLTELKVLYVPFSSAKIFENSNLNLKNKTFDRNTIENRHK